MQVALHSGKFHIFVVTLIILDILIVLFELLLDVGAFGELFMQKMLELSQVGGIVHEGGGGMTGSVYY